FALKNLQQQLNVSEEETMVFGDYNNDLEMLSLAYYSFAMENAHPNVKNTARFVTKSNDEEGVETILQQLIKEKKGIL
ncbi:MAG: HAD hydrolase family protein, partial [Flavobacteriaceae bacterium]|nr:HAD hydrolase family protein [Flavobacteriaceae bacterium]